MSVRDQIIAAAGDGMAADEIAEAMGLEKEVVEHALVQEGKMLEEDIPERDFQEIRSVLLDIAKNSKEDFLRAKVGMFLWEQKRGSAKMRNAPPTNLLQINQAIQIAHEKVKEALTLSAPPSEPQAPFSESKNDG